MEIDVPLSEVWVWKAYLCGYQLYHAAHLWLRDRYHTLFTFVRPTAGQKVEELRLKAMTMVIPEPDHWEF